MLALAGIAFPAVFLALGLAHGTIAIGSLTVLDYLTLADGGITAVKIGRNVVRVGKQIDKRLPRCDKRCQEIATESNLRAIESGACRFGGCGRHNP